MPDMQGMQGGPGGGGGDRPVLTLPQAGAMGGGGMWGGGSTASPVGHLMPPGFQVPPGQPPPQDTNQLRLQILAQNPNAAEDLARLAAAEYDMQKHGAGLEPEVMELASHFGLSDKHTRMLDEQLKKRNDTFDDDVA